MNEEMIFEISKASLDFMVKCMKIADKYGNDREAIALKAAHTHLRMCQNEEGIALGEMKLNNEREEAKNE